MPDEKGKLSEQEFQTISTYIDRKFPGGLKCSCCGQNNWNLEQHVMTAVPMGSGQLILFGQLTVYPQIAFLCSTCGHTLFFNAIALGILEGNSSATPEATSAS